MPSVDNLFCLWTGFCNGSGRKIELSNEDQKMCIDAAKSLGLEFAGVDLMKDEKGISYIIEVNGNPGTKIIDITSHNYFTDLVKHCKSKVKSDTGRSKSTSSTMQLQDGLYNLRGVGRVTVAGNGIYRGDRFIASSSWVGMIYDYAYEDFSRR